MKNKYDFPLFRWHLELSSKCTLSCSRCTRTGPENKHKYRVNQLSLDFVKSVLSPEILKRSRYMLFCGVFGDPIYNNNLIEIVKYMKQANPNMYLYIVTNGSHKKSEWWKQLAEHLNEYDSVVFSVDGWDQESNNLYRTNSDFNSIIEAIKVMVKSRASVKWSTILFRFNQNKMNDIKDLAQSLGVNHFDLVKSTKFGSPWVAEGDDDPLKPDKEFVSEHGVYDKYSTPLNKKIRLNNDLKEVYKSRSQQTEGFYSDSYIIPKCQIGD